MAMPAGTRWEEAIRADSYRGPLLEIDNLVVDYRVSRRRTIRAVAGVSFQLDRGETLGLVGESGCGKTSVARAVVNLHPPSAGGIRFNGKSLGRLRQRGTVPGIQMIFQHASASLNPGRSVGKTVAEPLRGVSQSSRRQRFRQAARMLKNVGIEPSTAFHRRPFEFSGGQCQRISIARALISSPSLLICDEPVSSLDVSVQAQILNLLRTIRDRYELTMLFISHDLAVVKNVSHRVAVMLAGRICEIAPANQFYRRPLHPYSATLLAAVPDPESAHRPRFKDRSASPGAGLPIHSTGCPFLDRCSLAQARCRRHTPQLNRLTSRRLVACHYPLQAN